MKDESFKGISNTAKLVYGMLLDRMALSVKNGWLDDTGRVYIYYSVDELCEDLNCSKPTVVKLLAELDSVKGIGLIEKKRQGFGKPDRIYVKNFIVKNPQSDIQEKHESEIEKEAVKTEDTQRLKNLTTENVEESADNSAESDTDDKGNDTQRLKILTSCGQEILLQKVKKFDPNNTEYNKTDMSNPLSSERLFIPLLISRDWLELKEKYPDDADMLNTISALITDTLNTDKQYLRICGNNCEATLIKKQFQKLKAQHIEYVLQIYVYLPNRYIICGLIF